MLLKQPQLQSESSDMKFGSQQCSQQCSQQSSSHDAISPRNRLNVTTPTSVLSSEITQQKYPNNYIIDTKVESCIVQEFLMINNGSGDWPKDTRLELTRMLTDIELRRVIFLNSKVPTRS